MTKSCIYISNCLVEYRRVTGLSFSDFDYADDWLEPEAVYEVAVMVGNRSQSLRLRGVAKGSSASIPFPLHCVWVVKEQEL
jgi:hypothetical protein